MPAARDFIQNWEAQCGGQRLHVRVKFFDEPTKVYINPAFRHIRRQRYILDVARRMRLLPCVKELLEESTDTPSKTVDGNLVLEGKTPTKEEFRVILGYGKIEAGGQTCNLVTFYPVTK